MVIWCLEYNIRFFHYINTDLHNFQTIKILQMGTNLKNKVYPFVEIGTTWFKLNPYMKQLQNSEKSTILSIFKAPSKFRSFFNQFKISWWLRICSLTGHSRIFRGIYKNLKRLSPIPCRFFWSNQYRINIGPRFGTTLT